MKLTIEDYKCEFHAEFHDKVKGRPAIDVARIAVETYSLDTTSEDFLAKYDGHAEGHLGNLDLMPGNTCGL